jgi:WD40 repeat protein
LNYLEQFAGEVSPASEWDVVGAISSDSNWALTGVAGGWLRFFDLNKTDEVSGTPLMLQVWLLSDEVQAVDFAEGTANWAAATADGKVYVGRAQRPVGGCSEVTDTMYDETFDMNFEYTAKRCDAVLTTRAKPTELAYSSDGKLIAVGGEQGLVALVKLDSKEQLDLDVLPAEATVTGVAFDPTGEYLAVAYNAASGPNSGIGRLMILTVNGLQANQVLDVQAHEQPVTAVDFSSDGKYVLTASEDGTAIAWVYRTGTVAGAVTFNSRVVTVNSRSTSQDCSLTDAKFLADGNRVVATCSQPNGNGFVVVWRFRS